MDGVLYVIQNNVSADLLFCLQTPLKNGKRMTFYDTPDLGCLKVHRGYLTNPELEEIV